jgi:hypothetical protein
MLRNSEDPRSSSGFEFSGAEIIYAPLNVT